MNDNEKSLIRDALATADPNKINKVCRDILSKRLQWDNQPDRKLRFLLDDVVKAISFPLSYDIGETICEKPQNTSESSSTGKVAIYGVIALIGIGISFISSTFINIIGAFLVIIGSFGIGRATASKPVDSVMKKSIIRINTSTESLEREVDDIYAALTRFYKYRQLEGRNIRILTWLQHFYADGATQQEKESIERLLALYGYAFRDFAKDNCADFEVYNGKVSASSTTEPAVYNEEGVAVCKGTAVIPSVD